MSYEMDPTEKVRLKEKARADLLAGKNDPPFALINGSAMDKERKTEFNRVYAAAHEGGKKYVPRETPAEDDIDVLRSIYEEQFGKPADRRKSAATLKEELGL